MAQDFTWNFNTAAAPRGWTAATIVPRAPVAPAPQTSAVGPVNAAAQNPVTAAQLRTTPSTLNDATLGSRLYKNPNTGIRDVAVQGSVYANPTLPAFLTQEVANLNAEQALRRSVQAEWNNKIFRMANEGGQDAYLWQEALRAASVNPGASVSFGAAVQNPLIGQGFNRQATSMASVNNQRAAAAARIQGLQNQIANINNNVGSYGSGIGYNWRAANEANNRAYQLQQEIAQLQPVATSRAPSSGGSGWATSFF